MIRAALTTLGLVAAAPVFAFDTMTQSMCRDSFAQLADYAAPGDPAVDQALSSIDASDGWCVITSGAAGFEGAEFETFAWRSDETDRWTTQGIPPLALQLRMTGLSVDEMQGSGPTDRPPLSFDATLRQLPEAGQIIVERAVLSNEAGDSIAVSGVFERVFLGSVAMMQMSLGSVAFKAGLYTMTLEGTHQNPFGFDVDVELRGDDEAQRQAAFDVISKLPEGVIDDGSRAELMAYAGDLPGPIGTLEVVAGSERGLGLMQLGGALYRSIEVITQDGVDADVLDLLLDGVTITADWTPTAQLAD